MCACSNPAQSCIVFPSPPFSWQCKQACQPALNGKSTWQLCRKALPPFCLQVGESGLFSPEVVTFSFRVFLPHSTNPLFVCLFPFFSLATRHFSCTLSCPGSELRAKDHVVKRSLDSCKRGDSPDSTRPCLERHRAPPNGGEGEGGDKASSKLAEGRRDNRALHQEQQQQARFANTVRFPSSPAKPFVSSEGSAFQAVWMRRAIELLLDRARRGLHNQLDRLYLPSLVVERVASLRRKFPSF